jgi:glycosyltransferase involved in cell wall biosynthesis
LDVSTEESPIVSSQDELAHVTGPRNPSVGDRIRRFLDDRLYETPSHGELGRSGRILFVEQSLPANDRDAGGLFIWQLIELLIAEGRQVSIYASDCQSSEREAGRLTDLGAEVLRPARGLIGWLRDNEANVAAVIVARPEVARLFSRRIRRTTRARLLYYDQDLHFLRERRRFETTGDPFALKESRRLERIERAVMRRSDAVLTPSPAEIAEIARIAPGTPAFAVTPFIEGPTPNSFEGVRHGVAMLGNYSHEPNVDGARWLVNEIMPIVWRSMPEVTVRIVGEDRESRLSGMASEQVEVLGRVDELRAAFSGSRVSAIPLRFGAGLKGKVLASVEAGVPVVTTTVGNEGIDLIHGRDAVVADTASSFAEAIVALHADSRRADEMAVSAARDVGARFSPERTRIALLAAIAGSPG